VVLKDTANQRRADTDCVRAVCSMANAAVPSASPGRRH